LFARNREKESGRAQAGAVAVGTDMFDHYFVEPFFHARIRFAALPVSAVVALDPSRDAGKSDLLADAVVALFLGFRRRLHLDFLRFDPIENGHAGLLDQL